MRKLLIGYDGSEHADAAIEDQTTKEWAAAEAARKAAGPVKKVAKKTSGAAKRS